MYVYTVYYIYIYIDIFSNRLNRENLYSIHIQQIHQAVEAHQAPNPSRCRTLCMDTIGTHRRGAFTSVPAWPTLW